MQTETKPSSMRIERIWPTVDWPRIWKNLWTASVSESTKTWYKIIHHIVPTKERLYKIRVAPT